MLETCGGGKRVGASVDAKVAHAYLAVKMGKEVRYLL